MNIEELLQQWEDDCIIDNDEPGIELIKIPKIHSKYLKILVKHKLILKKCNDELAIERKTKYNYYSGHYNTDKAMLTKLGLEPFKFLLKSDVSTYVDTDQAIIAIKDKVAYHEEMVAICTSIMATLKNRTWELKGYMDWERFKNGG